VAIALALSVPIVMLVVFAAISMLEVLEVGVLDTTLTVLDRVLMAFIFVELIATVRVTVREGGSFIAEPFLLVGLIAVVQRILLLTADLEGDDGTCDQCPCFFHVFHEPKTKLLAAPQTFFWTLTDTLYLQRRCLS
jgi:hypothetical protein